MSHRILIAAALLCVTASVAPGRSAEVAKKAASERSSVPRLYTATGPVANGRLADLRTAIGKLAGVSKVEAKPEFGAVTVTIDGDGASTESLLVAAARSAGYVMRPVRPRFFSATGSSGEEALGRLGTSLRKVAGVEDVALNERPGGATVRVTAVTPHAQLASSARAAGFELQAVESCVVGGCHVTTELTPRKSQHAPV